MSSNCNTHSKKKKLSNVWGSNRKFVTKKKLMKKINFYKKKTNFLITIYIDVNKFNGNIWRVILQFNFISFFVCSLLLFPLRGEEKQPKNKRVNVFEHVCVCVIYEWVQTTAAAEQRLKQQEAVAVETKKTQHKVEVHFLSFFFFCGCFVGCLVSWLVWSIHISLQY